MKYLLCTLMFLCTTLQAQSIEINDAQSIVKIYEQPTSKLLNKYNDYENVIFVTEQYIVKFSEDQVVIVNPVNNNRLQLIMCKPDERFLYWEAYMYENQ